MRRWLISPILARQSLPHVGQVCSVLRVEVLPALALRAVRLFSALSRRLSSASSVPLPIPRRHAGRFWASASHVSVLMPKSLMVIYVIVQQLTRFQLARSRRAVPQRQLGFLLEVTCVAFTGTIAVVFWITASSIKLLWTVFSASLVSQSVSDSEGEQEPKRKRPCM